MVETKNNSESSTSASPTSFVEKYKKHFVPAMAFAAAIVLIGGTMAVRHYTSLSSRGADASGCYGLGCRPSVKLGGRLASFGYGDNLSYGNLTVREGQFIELSWTAQNVDFCQASKGWTNFAGLYYPPTKVDKPMQGYRQFVVTCMKNNRPVAESTLNVIAIPVVTPVR